MPYCMGIDLGTSSLKALVLDLNGNVVGFAKRDISTSTPEGNHAEQDPELWWSSTKAAIKELTAAKPALSKDISGISFSGQMHGLVLLDRQHDVIRPAIIWEDQRAKKQVELVDSSFGEGKFKEICLNRLASGTTLASLLWVKENEPELFKRATTLLLPKDLVRFRMTGTLCTDTSDAAGSFAFGVADKVWAGELLNALGLPLDMFPAVKSSFDHAGGVLPEVAAETGLQPGTPVYVGGADQPLQAIGNAAISEGVILSNIGTGSQISTPLNWPFHDYLFRTYTFCHALPNKWYIMGASLNGGNSLEWLQKNILPGFGYDRLLKEASQVEPGSGGVVFLPYLLGERCPCFDPNAQAVFFGLRTSHSWGHLARSVIEGTVFALKESLLIMESLGITSEMIVASGGALHSEIWLQTQADIFEKKVYRSLLPEQACVGAAIVAAVGAGLFRTVADACAALVKRSSAGYEPKEANVLAYRRAYKVYRELYQRNLGLFGGGPNEEVTKLS
jgi:xylulokinase